MSPAEILMMSRTHSKKKENHLSTRKSFSYCCWCLIYSRHYIGIPFVWISI